MLIPVALSIPTYALSAYFRSKKFSMIYLILDAIIITIYITNKILNDSGNYLIYSNQGIVSCILLWFICVLEVGYVFKDKNSIGITALLLSAVYVVTFMFSYHILSYGFDFAFKQGNVFGCALVMQLAAVSQRRRKAYLASKEETQPAEESPAN